MLLRPKIPVDSKEASRISATLFLYSLPFPEISPSAFSQFLQSLLMKALKWPALVMFGPAACFLSMCSLTSALLSSGGRCEVTDGVKRRGWGRVFNHMTAWESLNPNTSYLITPCQYIQAEKNNF